MVGYQELEQLQQQWKKGYPLTYEQRNALTLGNPSRQDYLKHNADPNPNLSDTYYVCNDCDEKFNATMGGVCPACGSSNVMRAQKQTDGSGATTMSGSLSRSSYKPLRGVTSTL